MKKIIIGLVGIFLVNLFFVSCSSENDVLSQFSKRKYLKNFKEKNIKYQASDGKNSTTELASTTSNLTNYQLDEIVATDNSVALELNKEQVAQVKKIKEPSSNYSELSLFTQTMVNQNNKMISPPDTIYHVYEKQLVVKKVHWAAIASFVSGLIGFVIGGVVFGIIGIIAIASNPEKFKGKGWAIACIMISLLFLVYLLLLIAAA